MSIHNLTTEGSHKRPYAPLFEEDQTSKRRRLNDSPENNTVLQADVLHPPLPGLDRLASAATMDNREENLVTAICDLGTYLLENKPDVASAKFVE